jgi:hypothetical protein
MDDLPVEQLYKKVAAIQTRKLGIKMASNETLHQFLDKTMNELHSDLGHKAKDIIVR